MKELVINNDNLKEDEINEKVYRSRALIINSNNEILLGILDDVYQFPGGHVKENETILEGLKREVLEETGIILTEDYEPFYKIKYYNKNYLEEGINKYIEFNYFIINTDEKYNLDKMNLDEYEIKGNYELRYINLSDFENVLNDSSKNNVRRINVYNDMLKVYNEYLNYIKNN